MRILNRSCPSCAKEWPGRVACPDCLVELVDDVTATVRCEHCGKEWPAPMQSCPDCLAELHVEPLAAAEALGDILAAGGHLLRPDDVPPFRDGPACTLLRLSGLGSLVYLNVDGLVEAEVDGPGGRAVPPLTCRNVDGSVLFRLVRYQWWLRCGAEPLPLRTLAAVALLLAAKVFLGRPWPVPVWEEERDEEGWPPDG